MRVVAIGAVLVMMCLAGCAEPAPTSPPSGAAAATGPMTSMSPLAVAVRNRLTNTDNGMEVRRILVADDPARVVQALTSKSDGRPVSDSSLQQLKRNGLRFIRVKMSDIDALIADLGGATYDGNEWHGQVFEWRSLVDRSLDEAGRAVAIDGLVRRYERGNFRLMMRCWTVQMEDGPNLHFEMLPCWHVPVANNLRRLLAERAHGDSAGLNISEQGYASMALDLQLEAGYAYVLLSESPQVDWPELDGSGAGPAATQSARRPARSSDRFPAGPDAAPPPTLGELLLATPSEPPVPASRGLLIFIPRIPAELLTSESVAATSR